MRPALCGDRNSTKLFQDVVTYHCLFASVRAKLYVKPIAYVSQNSLLLGAIEEASTFFVLYVHILFFFIVHQHKWISVIIRSEQFLI